MIMNRKITTLLITIARNILLMAHGLGNPRGLLDSSRTETRTTVNHKISRRLTTLAMDILLIAHGIEDP